MGLVRIAESLHCALPPIRDSVQRLVSDDSLAQYAGEHHLIHTIHAQVAAGADFLDVNVDDLGAAGRFTFEQTVAALHRVLALVVEHGAGIPPCIDSSDPRLLEAGLRFYYSASRSGDAPGTLRPPLLNSVIASRLDLLALRAELRFSVIAMLLEKVDKDGQPFEHSFTEAAPAEAYWETARYLFLKCREAGFAPGEIFFDPTIGPLGADYVGYTRQTFEGIRRIKDDPELAGSHISIGLSNCSDGLPRRQSLNRAYLRVAQDYGVDAAVLDVTGVTGKERVHPWSLRLVRRVVSPKGGDPAAALEDLADYCAALPRPTTPSVTEPVRNTLAETLATPDGVVYTVELVPSVGDPDELYRFAEQARDSEIIPSITDTAGGARAPSPEMLGVELARVLDRQPIINISCKSEDRDGLIKRLTSLHQHGLRNVFAVTGDYPRDGRAVFDLDSVGLLLATWALKAGLDFPSLLPRRGGALPDLYAGAVASPFKYTEGDVWAQRVKLWKKWRAGASFFICQLGYDVKKFQELRLTMARDGLGHMPVIGNVYIVTADNVLAFREGRVAGVYLPPDVRSKYRGRLLTPEEKQARRQRSFSALAEFDRNLALRRAALLTDILVRGLGYRGVHFGGQSSFDDLAEVLAIKDELATRDWQENYEEYRAGDGTRELRFAPKDAFYLFPDGDDGLLRDGPVQTASRRDYPRPSRQMEWLHDFWFEADRPGTRLLTGWLEQSDREGIGRLVAMVERGIKAETLGCEQCGDCRIADLQYRCPEPTAGCYKSLINGACGGATVEGMCEVDAERPCYWRLVTESALASNSVEQLYRLHLPRDPTLRGSSSWRNHVLGRTVPPVTLGLPGANGSSASFRQSVAASKE